LKALLSAPERLPDEIKPLIRQLQAFHDPIPFEPEIMPKSRQSSLDLATQQILAKRLNDLFPCPSGARWITSKEWAKKRKSESERFLSVTSRIEKLSNCLINNVMFSTFQENPNNSVVAMQPGCAPQYGIIEKIFQHRRALKDGTSTADTWLVIQPLLPCNFTNPFAGVSKFELQVELRTIHTETLYVNHTQEILAHCAWIKYKGSEILPLIKKEYIALVSLDR
jgi:hypothetical protein